MALCCRTSTKTACCRPATTRSRSRSCARRRGSAGRTTWDAAWRALLVDNLEVLVRQLWAAGITEIFVDGSFVEDKDHPNDIDGYFVCSLEEIASGALQRSLNQLDPHKVWTWEPASRRPDRGSASGSSPCGIGIEWSSSRTSAS